MANVHTFDLSNDISLLKPPATQASANSSWVQPFANGGGADVAAFVLLVGAITNAIDMALYQATDGSGTGRKAITGAAITQVTSSTDNIIAIIEIQPGALDNTASATTGNSSFTYVRAEVTVAAAGSEAWALMLVKHRLRYPGKFTRDTTVAAPVRVY